MLLIKFKIAAILLGASASGARHDVPEVIPGAKVVYGPTHEGRYAVPGEGYIPTRDCTVTADGMRARLTGNGFLKFYGKDGELEGTCQVGERPVLPAAPAVTIRRGIAVAE